MAEAALVHVDLNSTIGALQIGSLFAVFIFGIVTLQTHIYYNIFQEDWWGYKTLVATVWLLEVGHTAGVSYEVYHATITLYGKPHLLIAYPSLGATIAIGGAITLLVQGFFAIRLYRVLPKPYGLIGITCLVLSFIRFVGCVVLTCYGVATTDVENFLIRFKWLISALLAGGASIDIVIALSMLYYLAVKRGQALERITNVIDRLIAYTVRTGLLTSVSAFAVLICFQVMPSNFVWLALYTFLAKLYSNSLLSALNARKEMREDVSHSIPSIDRYSRAAKNARRDAVNATRIELASQAISIEMKTTTETQDDLALMDKSRVGFPGPSQYHLSGDRKV